MRVRAQAPRNRSLFSPLCWLYSPLGSSPSSFTTPKRRPTRGGENAAGSRGRQTRDARASERISFACAGKPETVSVKSGLPIDSEQPRADRPTPSLLFSSLLFYALLVHPLLEIVLLPPPSPPPSPSLPPVSPLLPTLVLTRLARFRNLFDLRLRQARVCASSDRTRTEAGVAPLV